MDMLKTPTPAEDGMRKYFMFEKSVKSTLLLEEIVKKMCYCQKRA